MSAIRALRIGLNRFNGRVINIIDDVSKDLVIFWNIHRGTLLSSWICVFSNSMEKNEFLIF